MESVPPTTRPAILATNPSVPQDVRDVLEANAIGAAQFFTNAGKTSTDGVEVVLNWSAPTSNGGIFRLDASAAFISTDVSGDVNTDGLLEGLEDVIFTSQDHSIIEEWQAARFAIVGVLFFAVEY